jgi:hypothetical protein
MSGLHISSKVAERFGFICRGSRDSHRIYTSDGISELLNYQEVAGMAKPYPVKPLS